VYVGQLIPFHTPRGCHHIALYAAHNT